MTPLLQPTGETKEFGFEIGMTIAKAWELYKARVYHDFIPPGQELEVRQAFISGIAWLLGAMLCLPDDEEAAMAYMEALRNEVNTFSAETAERAAARSHLPPPGTRF